MNGTFLLASYIPTHIKDTEGIRHAIPLASDNYIIDIVNKYVPSRQKMVYIANNPLLIDDNKMKAKVFFESFKMSGLGFDNYEVLGEHNKAQSKEILKDADLIILGGGKIICQMNFFNEIGLKEILQNSTALTIGISAGAMNLCNHIFNFPEDPSDIPDPRIVKGLGFYNHYIIPHFDCHNLKYQLDYHEIDAVNDFILPFSNIETLIGLSNNSCILLHNGKEKFIGEYCIIKNGKVKIEQQPLNDTL